MWVKLHTKFLNWEWYSDINTTRLFIHLLLKANWKNGRFEGHEIKRGSFVTSLSSLSQETGLSVQQVRTSLDKLISTNEITNKSYSKFRVITIVNYEMYQKNNSQDNKQVTSEQQTSNNNNRIIEYKNIDSYSYIEQQFGRTLAPVEYQQIDQWQEWFTDDIINFAVTRTVWNGARALSYTEKIINAWHAKGFKTLEQCQNEGQASKKEHEPVKEVFDYDWLNEKEELKNNNKEEQATEEELAEISEKINKALRRNENEN